MASQVPEQECQTPSAERRSPCAERRTLGFGVPVEVEGPIAAAARDTGVEVYHVELSGRQLRVQVECESGATVKTCSDFSRALSARLDVVDFLHRQYSLEVSSPGIERTLYRPQDYAKAVNRHVRVLVRTGWVEGLLLAAGPEGITLATDRSQKAGNRESGIGSRESTPAASVEIAYADIRGGQIRVSDAELFASGTGRGQGIRESRNQVRHSNPGIPDPSNPVERNS